METSGRKINRRDFLKEMAAVVGGLAILPRLPNLPVPLGGPQRERKTDEEWRLEDVILDPEPFMDYVVGRLKALPPDQLTEDDKAFLMAYPSGIEGERSTNRNVLVRGYKEYGQKILDIRDSLKKLDIYPGRDADIDIEFFSGMIRPWRSLVDRCNGKGDFHVGGQEVYDLLHTGTWFQNAILFDDSYEEQKQRYIDRAKDSVDMEGIKEKIRSSWDGVFEEHEWHYIPEWVMYKDDVRDWFIKLCNLVDKYFPSAFSGVAEIRLTTGGTGRDWFSIDSSGGKIISICIDDFCRGFAAGLVQSGMLDANKVPQYLGGVPYDFFFDQHLIGLIHELAHGVDPLFNSNDFMGVHPDDYFSYLEEYVKLLKDWNGFLDEAKSEDVDLLLCDPLSIRCGFGIDQLYSIGDRGQFYAEMELLMEVCSHIEHPVDGKKYREIIKEMGLEALFIRNGEGMFKSWQYLLGSKGEHNFDQQIFIDELSSFDGISVNHLQEFRDMAQKYFEGNVDVESNTLQSSQWEEIAIKMKSMYIAAAYKFLKELVKRGELKNDGNVLYGIYQTFSQMVEWQVCHAGTGPFGEYLNLAYRYPSLSSKEERLLPDIYGDADSIRSLMGVNSSSLLIDCFKGLYEHVIEIQKRRGVLWGESDELSYTNVHSDAYLFGKG